MFDKDRYLTRGVSEEIPLEIQILLWSMIVGIKIKKGYLQVFEIELIKNSLLKIEHRQEIPKYKKEHVVVNIYCNLEKKISCDFYRSLTLTKLNCTYSR